MTPEQLAAKGTEHCHQRAVFAWAAMAARHGFFAADNHLCYTKKGLAMEDYGTLNAEPTLSKMFAIPNGGKRDAITATKLKAEGVKPGVSDIFLPVPKGGFCGLFIELKKIGGRASPEQKEFITAMQELGYGAVVVQGWQECVNTIRSYYQQKG